MRRQTLVAVMAILETDPSVTDEQSDLVADVLTGRPNRRGLLTPTPPPETPPSSSPEPLPTPRECMNTKEAADYLGMSERSIFKFKTNGELTFHRVGHKIIFKRIDLDEFLSRHKVEVPMVH